MRRIPAAAVAITAAAGLLLAACGSDEPADGSTTTSGKASTSTPASSGAADSATDGAVTGTVTVFAAASLTSSFDELADLFGKRYPGATVTLSYDGSSTLAAQLQQGALADVFASANTSNMDKVADLIDGEPTLFASNTLQIAVAPGNPKGITGLADLGKDDVITVLCAPEVPCGDAAHTALDAAGVTVTPASEEQNVTAVATKVAAGEADAGLIYRTDVAASDGAVDGIDFPESAEAVNTYPIGVLADGPNAAGGRAFVDLVVSQQGRKVLESYGFAQP